MPGISFNDFSTTINALEQYSALQKLPQSKRGGVPRLKREGDKLILTTASTMSRFDKFISFFGLGGYKLKNIVKYLQSDGFCQQLSNTALDAETRSKFESALSTLDRKITQYNTNYNSIKFSLKFFMLGFNIRIPLSIIRIFRPEISPKNKRLVHLVSTLVVDANKSQYVDQHKATQKLKLHMPTDNKLFADIKSGKVVIKDTTSCNSTLSPLELNRAYVFQERLKLQNTIRQPDIELFQLAFCRSAKPLRSELLKLFERMNKALDIKDEDLQKFSFEELKDHLFICKLQPWLDFFEVPQDSQKKLEKAFLYLKNQSFTPNELIDKHFISLKALIANTTIPSVALQSMVKSIKEEIYETVHGWASSDLSIWLRDLTSGKISDSDFEKNIAGFITSLQTGGIDANFRFALKWAPYLVKEMSQGLLGSSESLSNGVCWSISQRWAKQQHEYFDLPFDEVLQKMNFGNIEPRDRFNQARYALEKNKKNQILEINNLKDTPAIQQAIQKMLDFTEWQTAHKGIAHLSIRFRTDDEKDGGNIIIEEGHSITITAFKDSLHPDRSIFRILDSNHGAYDFPVLTDGADKAETLFIDCLSDLLSNYSQRINGLLLYPPA